MAIAGQPLEYRNVVMLYSAQTTQGTAVVPATALGLVDATVGRPSGTQRFRAPGFRGIVARKGGMIQTPFDITFKAVLPATKTLLLRGLRTVNGDLPWNTLAFGYQDDTPTTPLKYACQIRDCKIGSMELTQEAGAVLTARISGIGGLVTEPTTLVPAAVSGAPFWGYEHLCTIDTVAAENRSWSVSWNHNLNARPVNRGTAKPDFVRGWDYLSEGNEDITGSISVYAKPTANTHANTVSVYDFVASYTNLTDASTLVVTVTDLDYDDISLAEDENGIIWTTPIGGAASATIT